MRISEIRKGRIKDMKDSRVVEAVKSAGDGR
jgi:hypothetical protein